MDSSTNNVDESSSFSDATAADAGANNDSTSKKMNGEQQPSLVKKDDDDDSTGDYDIQLPKNFQTFNRFDVIIIRLKDDVFTNDSGINFDRAAAPTLYCDVLETFTSNVEKDMNPDEYINYIPLSQKGPMENACVVLGMEDVTATHETGLKEGDWFVSLHCAFQKESKYMKMDPNRTLISFMTYEKVKVLLSTSGKKKISVIRPKANMDHPKKLYPPGTKNLIQDDNHAGPYAVFEDVNGTQWISGIEQVSIVNGRPK